MDISIKLLIVWVARRSGTPLKGQKDHFSIFRR